MAKQAVIVDEIFANSLNERINTRVKEGYELIGIKPAETTTENGDFGKQFQIVTSWLVIFGSTTGEY